MDNKSTGLFKKFDVKRLDGLDQPGERHENCMYFCLDMDHDPYAKPALLAYADACEKDGYVQLAAELREKML